MKEFLRKVVQGHGISPSAACRKSFAANFAGAADVEWFMAGEHYEAIFYRNKLEHIALFGQDGLLMEYRKKLPVDFLPNPVRHLALSRGEIMNALMKNKGNMLEYELIVRKAPCERYLLVISDLGNMKEERML